MLVRWSTPVCRYCGDRLVLVRDHQQAREDQRAGGQQGEGAADPAEPGVGRELGLRGGGRELGRGAHGSGPSRGFVGGSLRRGRHSPAPRPGSQGRPPRKSGHRRPRPMGCGVPADSRRGQALCAAVPGSIDSRSPAPGRSRWVPGALAALGVGCTLAAIAIGALVDGGRPVDAGDATLGLLYPLVAALVLSRQPGNKVGWLLMVSVVTGPYLLAAEYVLLAGTTDGLLALVRRLAGRLGLRPVLRDRRAGPAVLPRRHAALAAMAHDRPRAHHRGGHRHGRRDAPQRPARLRARVREPAGRRAVDQRRPAAVLLHRLPRRRRDRRRRPAGPHAAGRGPRADPAAVAAARRVDPLRLQRSPRS